jgi:arylsulfatase A-like enzyme
MQDKSDKVLKMISVLLLIASAGLIALPLGADWLGLGGQAGFGVKQVSLIALGIAGLLLGWLLGLPASGRYLRAWRPAGVLRDQGPTAILLIGAWFGLIAGAGDVMAVLVGRYFLGLQANQGIDVVWMAPLANLVSFTLLAVVLSLVTRRLARGASFAVANFAFCFTLVFGLFKYVHQVHPMASLVLAAGLALQFTRFIGKRPKVLYFLVQTTLAWPEMLKALVAPPMAAEAQPGVPGEAAISRRAFFVRTGALLGGLYLAARGADTLAEGVRRTRLGPARAGAPNVLLIVLDTVRAQSLSLYGYHRRTSPQLDRLAQDGIVFAKAMATAPWTLPSHASMFTGRFHHELSTSLATPLDGTFPTLAEVLGTLGYVTAGFVANLDYCNREFGLARGFHHYEDYPISAGQIINSAALSRSLTGQIRLSLGNYEDINRKRAPDINRAYLSWLARQDSEQPYFAFLNYFDAHSPYIAPPEFGLKFSQQRPNGQLGEDWGSLTMPEIKELNDAYDGTLAYLDEHLGLLLDELAERRALDNTLVIITSDHGEHFGEHGIVQHASSLYTQVIHVPLLVRLPQRLQARRTISQVVTLRDLPATILEAVGMGGESVLPGQSLSRFWSDGAGGLDASEGFVLSEVEQGRDYPAWYPSVTGPLKSIVADGKHYIRNVGDGSEELYDIELDPEETQDLSATAEAERLLPRFRALLDKVISG